MTTLASLLQSGTERLKRRDSESPALDVALLLQELLGFTRVQLHTQGTYKLSEAQEAAFETLLLRREQGEPVAYLLGEKEFFGHTFCVSPAVLIPRPDTEKLVEEALALLLPETPHHIIDVCTGSACIAISLALARPKAKLWATDLSPLALEIAQKNVQRYELQDRVTLLEGDLLTPCADLRDIDLIVANPPYIKPEAMGTLMRDVRDFEPHLALVGEGAQGLGHHARILESARSILRLQGSVIMEIGYDQWHELEHRAFDGFGLPHFVRDEAGHIRLAVYRSERG